MADNWDIPQPNSQRMDRRGYDATMIAFADKVESLQKKVDRLDDVLIRLNTLESEHRRSGKDIDEHDAFIKAMQSFVTENKQLQITFESHMKAQQLLNEKLSVSIQKNTDFQNRLIMIGGVVFLLWQTFGLKLFSAAEALIK